MLNDIYTHKETNIEFILINILNESEGLFQIKPSPINLLNIDTLRHPVIFKLNDLYITPKYNIPGERFD